MRFNDNDRKRFDITAVTSLDPTAGTIVLAIDGTEYPCTWDGAATQDNGRWIRKAHTDTFFAGPAVPAEQAAGAVVLAPGVHQPELRVSIGGTIIAQELPRFSVRA